MFSSLSKLVCVMCGCPCSAALLITHKLKEYLTSLLLYLTTIWPDRINTAADLTWPSYIVYSLTPNL